MLPIMVNKFMLKYANIKIIQITIITTTEIFENIEGGFVGWFVSDK